jgi:hypothetical protein
LGEISVDFVKCEYFLQKRCRTLIHTITGKSKLTKGALDGVTEGAVDGVKYLCFSTKS